MSRIFRLSGAEEDQSAYQLAAVWSAQGMDFESWSVQDISLLNVVQAHSETHKTSYPLRAGGCIHGR
jgi:hypothetical protein